MSKKFACAVVGLGRIGVTLEEDSLREKPATHSGAITAHPDAVLVAGADTDTEARERFAQIHSRADVFDDASAMLNSCRPDIVHIAAWTEDHVPLLRLALDRKIKVVVCEKPLAGGLNDLGDLMDRARVSGSHVIMNHERRFSADYREVRETIRAQPLGDLLRISTHLYMGKTRTMEEVLYHDGTHMLDILRFLTDGELEINYVQGDARTEGGSLDVLARAGDCLVAMEFAGGHDHLVFELDLAFASGRIRIGNGIFERWESVESPFYSGYRSLRKVQEGWQKPTGYFSGMMSHALELAADPGALNESSLDDGYAVLCLMDEILARSE